jgi:tRNA-modifying protein YgfZ
MGPRRAPDHEVEALEQGRAFVDLCASRKVRVRGSDARAWLGDLITSDVASLKPGASQRSLLLTPTGKIRADLAVGMDRVGYLLLQAPDQPDPVDRLLEKYVLSSEVSLSDVTASFSLYAVPGEGNARSVARDAADLAGGDALAPSVLGPGIDIVPDEGAPSRAAVDALVRGGLVEVGAEAVEVWRILRGAVRMGTDFGQDALPAEAGLEGAIDTAKGCFLGQESVARVRNLGHAPSLVRHVVCARAVDAGSPVFAGGSRVGEVTSAAVAPDGRIVALIHVRWDAKAGPWSTQDGVALGSIGSTD